MNQEVAKRQIRIMRIIARMNVGGPAVQVSGLMQGIDSDVFDHRLYTGFCGANEADYLDSVARDIKAKRIEGFGRSLNLSGDLKAFMTLLIEIRKFKPHVIHTHTAKAGTLGRIASVLSFYPSIRVHTFHGHLLHGYFGPSKRHLVVLAEKILARFSHQLLAVGEKVRQDLLVVGVGTPKKFSLMPPGLEIGDLPDKSVAQESYGLCIKNLQVALIGRVTQIKRPDRFLDVVSEIKKRGLGIEFFIAGDGELLEGCRERIAAEELPVNVLGWQSDIERVLAAADIVILTSDNEGTPLSLIQAGMAALPVVTTNVGSIPEVVKDGVTGIITRLDVMELADAIEKLVGDVELRARMGSAAQEFTMANFGVNRLVHDHEELYKRLIANRAKS
jgi:glycosyltransferase involved in cell wall biosynthesis